MRERLAKGIAVATIAVIAVLAFLFARLQNPSVETTATSSVPTGAPAPAEESPPSVQAGREIYDRRGCALCHSIAGEGNPRYPLDGVGARRERAVLRGWILGLEAPADSLPPSALRVKRGYQDLPAGEIEALLDFVSSLKSGG